MESKAHQTVQKNNFIFENNVQDVTPNLIISCKLVQNDIVLPEGKTI